MQTELKWKKGIFSDVYKIYSGGEQVGTLKDKSFSQSAKGSLYDKDYVFKTKGFFKQKTLIIDAKTDETIGEVNYNSWMTKATITINDETYNWKYENLWNTRWSLNDSEGTSIQYSGSKNGGQIDSTSDDALLLMSGLFITNYYKQMTVAVLVAVFVPIWASGS